MSYGERHPRSQSEPVGFFEYVKQEIKDASWGARIAGGAAAAVALYGVAVMVYPPARQPLVPIVEMLSGEDINNSAPASYPELLQLYSDLSAPAEFPVEPDAITNVPNAGESFAYQYAAGETGFLYP